MALVKATLTASLTALFGTYSATTDAFAAAFVLAYKTYAAVAQSCASLTPTKVNDSEMEDLVKALPSVGGSYSQAAQKYVDALDMYWLGDGGVITPAQFGATGLVTSIAGSAALKSALEAGWQAAVADADYTAVDAAVDHANWLDTYTKTVLVVDSAIPCTATIL